VTEAAELAERLGLDVRLPGTAAIAGEDAVPEPPTPQGAIAQGAIAQGADEGAIDELPCDWPWRSSYVNHDGRVQPCCMLMGDDRATMGSLGAAGGFAAVWNGERYTEFRERLLSPAPPDVCRGCAYYRGHF
jgi:radical SAM protein with 4Fe4S-binding SPASM domain